MNVVAAQTQAPAARREYRDATRELSSILTPLEERCLLWLAARMPRWVNSDHLTSLALVAMVGAGLSYWLASTTPIGLVLVVVFLAINWFGDSLDGTLARFRNQQRPRYGFYVDHVVDAFGALFLLGGLALSGYMHPLVAAGLLLSYLMVCVETFLATHCVGTFRMSALKIGPTELRILLAFGNLMLFVQPSAVIFGHEYRLFDISGVIGALGLMGTMIVSSIRNTRTLYLAEPIPARKIQ